MQRANATTYVEMLDALVEARAVPDELGPIECQVWGGTDEDLEGIEDEVPDDAVRVTRRSLQPPYEMVELTIWIEGGVTDYEATEIKRAYKELTG